jgi:hypothetical protein
MSLKNILPAVFIFALALGGCGLGGQNPSGRPPMGIPECDKLFAKIDEKSADKSIDLNANSNSTRGAAYRFLRDEIAKPLRKEIAKPDANKKELAEQCKGAYEAFVPQADQ